MDRREQTVNTALVKLGMRNSILRRHPPSLYVLGRVLMGIAMDTKMLELNRKVKQSNYISMLVTFTIDGKIKVLTIKFSKWDSEVDPEINYVRWLLDIKRWMEKVVISNARGTGSDTIFEWFDEERDVRGGDLGSKTAITGITLVLN